MGNTTNKPIERYDLSETPKSIFGLKLGPDDNYDSETKMTCSDLSMFNSRYRTYVFDTKEAFDDNNGASYDPTRSKESLDKKVRDETDKMFNEDFDMGRRNSNLGAKDSTKKEIGSETYEYCYKGDVEKIGTECTTDDQCEGLTGTPAVGFEGKCTASINENDSNEELKNNKSKDKANKRMSKKSDGSDATCVDGSSKTKPALKGVSDRPPSYNNDKLEVLAMFDLCNRAKDASGNCRATVDEVKWAYPGSTETSSHIIPGGFRCVNDTSIVNPEDWGTAGSS